MLTHEHQLYLRKEHLSQNQQIETERKELANRKHLEKMTRDDAIVGSLCKKLELGGLLSVAEIGTVKEERVSCVTMIFLVDCFISVLISSYQY
jgi:hypothetical protein